MSAGSCHPTGDPNQVMKSQIIGIWVAISKEEPDRAATSLSHD